MYEAMLVTMDDIMKSNVHNIVVNEKSKNESNKIITKEKTIDTVDKCLNENSNSILVDHVNKVQQDDKVTSITNNQQDVPVKRKFPDDFMHINKRSKPDSCQSSIDTEKKKALNENCKKSLNFKSEKKKVAVNVVSSFSNVNTVEIIKANNSVKKNKVTSVQADSTDNDDDITIIESKKTTNNEILNDKAPVNLKAPTNKTQNDKNDDQGSSDDITIIESEQINTDKNINDKTPTQLKTPTSQTQNDKAEKHCDNIIVIENKKISKDKSINDKTTTKLNVPINKTQKEDKAENRRGDDDITLIENKKINTNKIINEKTSTKVKTPVKNIQKNDKIDNHCNDLNKPNDNNIVNKNSNKVLTVENIKITSVQSMAPVTTSSIDVVTLDDDDSIQVTEVEVPTEDCIDNADDDVVIITNNLNNTNGVELQVHSNEISSRDINEIIDDDHNYSKKITDTLNNETTSNNSMANCHENNTSMENVTINKSPFVTVHFCDVNKLEDINFSDSLDTEEYNEINSTNDNTKNNNFPNYYDHDYNGDDDDNDDDEVHYDDHDNVIANDNINDPIDTMNDSTNFNNIGRIVNDIPFEEKKRIVNLAEKHPTWTIRMLRKKSGCEKLLGQHQLNSWKKMVERGGSTRELRYSFNNWIFNKCLEFHKQNKKITNKKIQNWGMEAKKLSCYKNLRFVATHQWLETFKRNYRITGKSDDLIIDPKQQKYSYKLSRVLVPYELKVKVVNLESEHKDWSLEMLKKHSGCNYLESFAQITSWRHLIKKGQSLWDKYKKLNNWIYNKYNEYKSKNKKVTDKMLISWRNEAKKVLQFNELPKINHNYQWVRTFKRDFNIT
ncbi:protein PFC0760c-like [Aphidius gifuensis]|uniref:protein PFC0760c-like n=1 Tax=Aphidius gifuensis TaxID=684658 RepID=UPI001CDC759A|nr:protein PFC0760c-like [Aphidius gifuensis]